MAREKALLIGAQPPFSGQWIPISEVASWVARVETRPVMEMEDHIEVEVMDHNGDTRRQPIFQIISGVAVKGHIKGTIGPVSISVYLEAVQVVTV